MASVSVTCSENCFDPTTTIVRQANALDEMVYISQESPTPLADYNNNYYFDDAAGENINVYIVDSGADLSHVVSYVRLQPIS
jgi:hypothetical protein